MLTVMEDIADLTYSHNLSTFVRCVYPSHTARAPAHRVSRRSQTVTLRVCLRINYPAFQGPPSNPPSDFPFPSAPT